MAIPAITAGSYGQAMLIGGFAAVALVGALAQGSKPLELSEAFLVLAMAVSAGVTLMTWGVLTLGAATEPDCAAKVGPAVGTFLAGVVLFGAVSAGMVQLRRSQLMQNAKPGATVPLNALIILGVSLFILFMAAVSWFQIELAAETCPAQFQPEGLIILFATVFSTGLAAFYVSAAIAHRRHFRPRT